MILLRTVITLLLLAFGLTSWSYRVDRRAEAEAKAFCDGIVPGILFSEVAEIAKEVGEDRLRSISAESISVGFIGVSPFSYHLCEIRRAGDSVGERQYIYLN